MTTPPSGESSPGSAVPAFEEISEELARPPRSTVLVPGLRSVFGRGFWSRLRQSRREAWFTLCMVAGALALCLFGAAGTFGPYKGKLGEHSGVAFVIGAGLFLVFLQVLEAVLKDAEKKLLYGRQERDEPWTWDYPWRKEWMAPDYTGGESGTPLWRVTYLAFVVVLNVALLGDPDQRRNLGVIWVLLLLDVTGLILLYDSLKRLGLWLRFRHPVVTWMTSPAFLGDRLAGRISFARPLLPKGPLQVTLRCVQEVWTVRKTKDREERVRQPYIVYKDKWEFPLAEKAEPLDYVDFDFDIPNGPRGTDLRADLPAYWQIHVTVPVAGPDLEADFLAPVYRLPATWRRVS